MHSGNSKQFVKFVHADHNTAEDCVPDMVRSMSLLHCSANSVIKSITHATLEVSCQALWKLCTGLKLSICYNCQIMVLTTCFCAYFCLQACSRGRATGKPCSLG